VKCVYYAVERTFYFLEELLDILYDHCYAVRHWAMEKQERSSWVRPIHAD